MIETALPLLDYRDYQKPLIAYMREGGKRAVWVAHRRSGKDVTCWQYMVEAAIQETGTYYYCLPEFTHARRVIFEGMLNDGKRFISLVPQSIVTNINESQMKIELVNGSIIQLVGSDQFDRLVGTNPKGIVFSEYSITHPMAWQILRPILAANGGWAIFNGTPRGKNHFHDMLLFAKSDPSWFWSVDTVTTTNVLSQEVLNKEKAEMDADVFLQEYYCSFDAAIKGAYYSEQLKVLREQQRLCKVPYEPVLPVYTASDPGDVNYAIVYFQVHGKEVRIMDADELFSPSPESVFATITEKPYKYAKHFLPNDATVKKMGAGQRSLMDQLRDAGLQNMESLPPQNSKMEGIKLVQSHFPSFWIEESLEKKVLGPLGAYAPKYYDKRNTYSSEPEHNWASHMSDAVRYLAIALARITATFIPRPVPQRKPLPEWARRAKVR
jgi:phage terminase large subunit